MLTWLTCINHVNAWLMHTMHLPWTVNAIRGGTWHMAVVHECSLITIVFTYFHESQLISVFSRIAINFTNRNELQLISVIAINYI